MSHGAFSFPVYVPVMGTHDIDLKEVALISRKWSLHSQGETDCAAVIRRHGKDWDERNMSGDLPPFRPRAGFPEWDWIFPGRGLKAEEDLGRLGQLMELQGRRVRWDGSRGGWRVELKISWCPGRRDLDLLQGFVPRVVGHSVFGFVSFIMTTAVCDVTYMWNLKNTAD